MAGVIAATKQYSIFDNLATGLSLLGVSMPTFWQGLMLIIVFAVWLRWLPASGFSGPRYWILPVLAIGPSTASTIMRMTRSSIDVYKRQEQILGSTLEETIPPLAVFAPRLGSAKEGEAAKEEMPVKDRIITFEEQLLSISVYPLSDPEGISGHLILIKRFTDIEKEQYTLRRQIVSRGYAAKYSFDDIVGRSESIITLKETAGKMARSDSALLIYGQSGTGKELFAQSVHNSSNRKDNPFIAINCASIPENLLESRCV